MSTSALGRVCGNCANREPDTGLCTFGPQRFATFRGKQKALWPHVEIFWTCSRFEEHVEHEAGAPC